ncbi:MAG: hypothetical protein KGH59_02040 [Candidatus Micrarchaeota archaeon]|nr:hypothetical protein [Candidatus Micrarchaeota archaeon]MDE1804543.1 hypothetical protein [Candidatus Micrarchaeota archaeon]MDE1846901.1 hypothetical protein [Candidatus Micrarchaeota archaeon]
MRSFEYFKALFGSRSAILTTLVLAVIYYIVIEYIVKLGFGTGQAFVTVPQILIYTLAISAAALLTISLHSIRLSVSKARNEAEGILSIATALIGGVVAGCNCEVPIVASLLYLLAFNATTVSSVISFLANYQLEIFVLLIIVNVAVSAYHLSRLSSSCTIKNGRLVPKRR